MSREIGECGGSAGGEGPNHPPRDARGEIGTPFGTHLSERQRISAHRKPAWNRERTPARSPRMRLLTGGFRVLLEHVP
jgi:hypothetical protein